jgi:hypothetical protein
MKDTRSTQEPVASGTKAGQTALAVSLLLAGFLFGWFSVVAVNEGRAGFAYLAEAPTMSDGSVATMQLIAGGVFGTLCVVALVAAIAVGVRMLRK